MIGEMGDGVREPYSEVLRDEAALADWEGEGGTMKGLPRGLIDRFSDEIDELDGRNAPFQIEEDLSYLGLSWLTSGEVDEERPAGRQRMSYVEARSMWDPYLTVERFSFFVRLRDTFKTLRQLREAER